MQNPFFEGRNNMDLEEITSSTDVFNFRSYTSSNLPFRLTNKIIGEGRKEFYVVSFCCRDKQKFNDTMENIFIVLCIF
jgi:hypothetical protein